MALTLRVVRVWQLHATVALALRMNSERTITPRVHELALRVWNYHRLNHVIEPADCIGNHDLRVAERAVELYAQGIAPIIVFSGNTGVGTTTWSRPEAEIFAEKAIAKGVSPAAILTETKASNTGENIRYTQALLREKGIAAKRIILVQKPYMERRSYATFMKQWDMSNGTVDVRVTSPQMTFDAYCSGEIPAPDIIDLMVGDLQRIREYPKLGFQIAQVMDEEIWLAAQELMRLGFDCHMLK